MAKATSSAAPAATWSQEPHQTHLAASRTSIAPTIKSPAPKRRPRRCQEHQERACNEEGRVSGKPMPSEEHDVGQHDDRQHAEHFAKGGRARGRVRCRFL